ncbi:phenylacetate--CoA ligase family protein [Candidatus Leptofilum sp.]|uniref:phenylacetate--CoA ligase family protein n=1 Tax=Candidatus Leptofilum sp. TaxID=3241576 RepID=UPI003B58E383
MTHLDEKLKEAVQYAYENAPAVKAWFDKVGITPNDIRSVADLPKIPVLPKDEIVALQQASPPFGGMLGIPPEKVTHIFFSPGPIYEPAPEPDEGAWDVAVGALKATGFRPGDVVLNSFSYHLVPAGYLFDNALVRLGCTVVPGGTGSAELQLKMMQDLKVTGYSGTPSFLMNLIKKAEASGIDFKNDLHLKTAIFSAEPLPPTLRQTFVEQYGIAVGNAYATADFGLLALNTGDGMAMPLLPEPIIEVVDSETGQPVGPGEAGEVVATNFSRAYPLIRIGTGDMAMNMDPNPGQSQQTERSIILVGRSGEAAKVRGMFVHPNQLRFATGQIPGVQKVQGVVSRPELKDYFVVRVEAEGVDETAVSSQIKTAVQGLCRVRVDEVEFISPGTLADDAPGMVDDRDWQA